MTTNLTQSQLLLWTGQHLNSEAPFYNMVLTFNLEGAIDPVHFQRAFQALVDRCDALRTVFQVSNGVPQQAIRPRFTYQPDVLDWSHDPDAEATFRSWAEKRSQKQFDLTACAFESILVKLSPTRSSTISTAPSAAAMPRIACKTVTGSDIS